VRGIPELIQNGHRGLTIRLGDRPALRQAIQSLASHPERRKSMGAIAQQRVREPFDTVTNCRWLARIFANSIDQNQPVKDGSME
jgi:glycosyltransferase involved in cell wall biosynthesis